ncbi:MAG TPA: DUF4276 family protein [Thermoanaerobaculia bacterium]|jgi:hypothetical protein|nr:DUF4276 family protein [Thermoanaerobaculia bacterium]
MKFMLFVEGATEKILPSLLKGWLDPRLPVPVGIRVISFEGVSDYYTGIRKRVELSLDGSPGAEVIAAIGLLDLYGFYPADKQPRAERYAWAKAHVEDLVKNHRFRQHFAIHETEAWLLADPEIFPRKVKGSLPRGISRPETVNFDNPPARLLARLYQEKLGRKYKKVIDGATLFRLLSPERAYEKCPALKALLDDMLELAQAAG